MSATTADNPSTSSPTPKGTPPVRTSVSVPVRTFGSCHCATAITAVSTAEAAVGSTATTAPPRGGAWAAPGRAGGGAAGPPGGGGGGRAGGPRGGAGGGPLAPAAEGF